MELLNRSARYLENEIETKTSEISCLLLMTYRSDLFLGSAGITGAYVPIAQTSSVNEPLANRPVLATEQHREGVMIVLCFVKSSSFVF